MSERISVFSADDHPLVSDAVQMAIRTRPDLELVGVAADGRTALEEIRRLQPDVALLDMRMPGLEGGQILTALVRDDVPTRVLFLSTSADSGTVYDLLAAGAAGYVEKAASADEICDAIRTTARGHTVVAPEIEQGLLQQIRMRGREKTLVLTAREQEVLMLVADGVSAPGIARMLYIEPSTVKTHLQNIYEKLGVSERAAAVAEGMRRGLLE